MLIEAEKAFWFSGRPGRCWASRRRSGKALLSLCVRHVVGLLNIVRAEQEQEASHPAGPEFYVCCPFLLLMGSLQSDDDGPLFSYINESYYTRLIFASFQVMTKLDSTLLHFSLSFGIRALVLSQI